MKRFLFILAFSSLNLAVFSQIPNADFENWTSTGFPAYQNPNGWGNLNGSTWLGGIGVLTCERASGADAHTGSYAMKLTSKTVLGLGDAPGIAVTGTINTSTQALNGGFAYTQRPTHLKGWYKYSPAAGDNCEISVTLWRRNGGVKEDIGEGELLTSTAIPSYTRLLVPITYTSANAPDSGQILLVSTNTDNIQIGSQLFIDGLEFIDCSGLTVSLSKTDITTIGGADGTATASVSGGTGPYNYYWSPSAQATATIINLASGSYCVTVEDVNGCTSTNSCAIVNEPGCSGFSVSLNSTDVSTVGGNDGSITATPAGGTAPYTYDWSTNDTSQAIVNLAAGNYCVTVVDSVGCQDVKCDTIHEPSCLGFSVSVSTTDETVAGANDGTATANPTGGTAPYIFLWPNLDTAQTQTNLEPGEYCPTVTDAVGCSATACDSVLAGPTGIFSVSTLSGFQILPNPAKDHLKVELTESGSYTISIYDTGGKLMMKEELNTLQTTLNISNLKSGSYFYSITQLESGKTGFGKLVVEE